MGFKLNPITGKLDLVNSTAYPTILIASADASPAVKAVADIVCDGIDDDEDFQAAHDSLDPDFGGRIQVTEGNFNFSQTVTITIKKGFHLEGMGYGTIFNIANGMDDYLFTFNPTSDGIWATFSNFKIAGNAANQSAGGGIYAAGALECSFEHIWLHQCYDWGLQLLHISDGNYGHNNRVENCLFDEGDDSAGIGGGIYMEQNDENDILNNHFHFMGGTAGISSVLDDGYCVFDKAGLNKINNNSFVNSSLCVQIRDSGNTIVSDNVFDRPKMMGLMLRGRQNTAKGNIFYQMGENSGTTNIAIGLQIEFYNSEQINNNWFISAPTTNATRSFIKDNSDTSGGGDHQLDDNYFFVDGSLGTGILELTGGSQRNLYGNNRGNTLFPVKSITGDYTASPLDRIIAADASGGNSTVTLPAASRGFLEIQVIKSDASANTVTVIRAGTDTIESDTTVVLSSQYDGVILLSDSISIWYRQLTHTASGSIVWGGITGTLSDQSDLQAALDAKQDTDALLNDIATLSDPGGDRILFWDDSAGEITWLDIGSGLSITGTTLSASGGGGSPGGSDTQLQYNNGGSFGGIPELVYDDTTGTLVFNDAASSTADFRMESDTLSNIFFLDASTDRIGINTASPGALFGINGTLRMQDDAHTKSFDLLQDEFQSRIKANNTGWVLESANFSDISLEPSGGNTNGKLKINSNRFQLITSKTPLSASDGGDAGDICWDSGFIYVCVASNTWKRAAISTW